MNTILVADTGGTIALILLGIGAVFAWAYVSAHHGASEFESKQTKWRQKAQSLVETFAKKVEAEDLRLAATLRGRRFALYWRNEEPTKVNIDLAPSLAQHRDLNQLPGGARIQRELVEIGAAYAFIDPSDVLSKAELFEEMEKGFSAELRSSLLEHEPYPNLEFAFTLESGGAALESKVSSLCDLASRLEMLTESATDELFSLATTEIGTDQGYEALAELVRHHRDHAAIERVTEYVKAANDANGLILLAREGHVSEGRILEIVRDAEQPVAVRVEAAQWLRTQPRGVPMGVVSKWLASSHRALRTFSLETATANPSSDLFPPLAELATARAISPENESRLIQALGQYGERAEPVLINRLESVGTSRSLVSALGQFGGQLSVAALRSLRAEADPTMIEVINAAQKELVQRLGVGELPGALSMTDSLSGGLAIAEFQEE